VAHLGYEILLILGKVVGFHRISVFIDNFRFYLIYEIGVHNFIKFVGFSSDHISVLDKTVHADDVGQFDELMVAYYGDDTFFFVKIINWFKFL